MREKELLQEVPLLLEKLVEQAQATSPQRKRKPPASRDSFPWGDVWVETPAHTWLVECKASGTVAAVAAALARLRAPPHALSMGSFIPVVAVPFMGEAGRQLCDAARISWVDLAGNAHLRAPGLYVHIEGRPPLHKQAGRPENPFAPRSARVTRRLLLEPQRFFTQRELAQSTELGEGFVSRIVRRLEADGLLSRDSRGRVRPAAPALLLESWRERDDFLKHRTVKGHVAARSPTELLHTLSSRLEEQGIAHAATGLAAAWMFTRFATFRTVTLYLQRAPRALHEVLGFREESRGANVWLTVPHDAGVFEGAERVEGVRCVSAVQAYVDLKAQPERAEEAAAQLKRERLDWNAHG